MDNVVIPLAQPDRCANGQDQALQESGAEGAAVKAEAELIQVGLEIGFGQAVIGSQNERLGVADNDMQPVQQTGVGIVRFVLMGVAFQCRDVAAVAVAADRASLGKCRSGKFFDGCPLDVWSDPHLEAEWTA